MQLGSEGWRKGFHHNGEFGELRPIVLSSMAAATRCPSLMRYNESMRLSTVIVMMWWNFKHPHAEVHGTWRYFALSIPTPIMLNIIIP